MRSLIIAVLKYGNLKWLLMLKYVNQPMLDTECWYPYALFAVFLWGEHLHGILKKNQTVARPQFYWLDQVFHSMSSKSLIIMYSWRIFLQHFFCLFLWLKFFYFTQSRISVFIREKHSLFGHYFIYILICI